MERFSITKLSEYEIKNESEGSMIDGGYSYMKCLVEDKFLRKEAIIRTEIYSNGGHIRIDIERKDTPENNSEKDQEVDEVYWIDSAKDMIHYLLYGEDMKAKLNSATSSRKKSYTSYREIENDIIKKNALGEGRLD